MLATRIAKWLGIAYALAVVLIFGPGVGDLSAFFGALVFLPWQVGPVFIAAIFVKASESKAAGWIALGIEIGLIASTIWLGLDITFNRENWSSVGGSIFIGLVGPFYQYMALAVAFPLAYLVGWRARPEWLRDIPPERKTSQ